MFVAEVVCTDPLSSAVIARANIVISFDLDGGCRTVSRCVVAPENCLSKA